MRQRRSDGVRKRTCGENPETPASLSEIELEEDGLFEDWFSVLSSERAEKVNFALCLLSTEPNRRG